MRLKSHLWYKCLMPSYASDFQMFNEAVFLVLLHSYPYFMINREVNVKWRPVLCLNARRKKYVYIAGTKGTCHAAYDWYWLAAPAARWAELRRFNMRGRGLGLFTWANRGLRDSAAQWLRLMCLACLRGTLTSWHCIKSVHQQSVLNIKSWIVI